MGGSVEKLKATCTCDKSESPEEIFKLFYGEMLIRKKSIEDVAAFFKSKKPGAKNITDTKFNQIITEQLHNENYDRKIIDDFWNNVITYFRTNSNEWYMFGSLLFLGEKNKELFLTKFPEMTKKMSGNKNLFTEDENTKELMIAKEEMKKIIFSYIMIISHFGIQQVKEIIQKDLEIDRMYGDKFSEENIHKYVEENLMGEKYSQENVSFTGFINEFYDKLSDDCLIRDILFNLK